MRTWTDTLEALHRGVCEAPEDTTARLVFADCCDESGDSGLCRWAELIRCQVALSQLGPPPLVVEDVGSIRRKGGPDYYQLTADRTDTDFATGQRIDVRQYVPQVDRAEGRTKPTLHGLRIAKVEPSGYDPAEVRLTLVRDEHSTPYPSQRAAELQGTAAVLISAHWASCTHPGLTLAPTAVIDDRLTQRVYSGPYGTVPNSWHFRDGFISELRTSWVGFVAHLNPSVLLTQVPLRRISFSAPPVLETRVDADNRLFVTTLSGLTSPKAAVSRSIRSEVLVREVALSLLKQTWPTVTRWDFPG